VILGSPDVSRAVIDQAQNFSGVSSNILKKMLPLFPLGSGQRTRFGLCWPPMNGSSGEDGLACQYSRKPIDDDRCHATSLDGPQPLEAIEVMRRAPVERL
jgi:hypothetical protein